jgi:hypothetical protein
MSVVVYPRLRELLRSRSLTVAELERQIKQQFGLSFDSKTLYRLAQAESIQRADMKLVGAAAVVLGVRLCDLFDVQTTSIDDELTTAEASVVSSEKSQRLAKLFNQQSQRPLRPTEQRELDELVAEYVHNLRELRVREYAKMHGISVEQARHEMVSRFNDALDEVKRLDAKPEPLY